MKFRSTLLFLFLIIALESGGTLLAQTLCPIIPMPNQASLTTGNFILNTETRVQTNDPSFASLVSTFENQVLQFTGIALKKVGTGSNEIFLERIKPDKKSKPGSYSLKMSPNRVTVQSADKEGLFNGLQSLLQLALFSGEPTDQGLKLANWQINDQPLYEWRGFMLDESRHFFGKEVVKKILDQMALLKLNSFHWHLTDSQGWRLEIKTYPKLTLVGGIGNDTDSLAAAKYYTQQDIHEIVNYAQNRQIEIIPEIDMPGHATAANKAYPEYSGGKTEKFPDFTFNPGKEKTYAYLTQILKETAVLFPSGYIHLGGDEVSFGIKAWENNPDVQSLMRNQKLSDLKAVEHYFFERMTGVALQNFNKVMAWDEAVDSGVSPENTIIYWWRHDQPEQLKKALDRNFKVILSPRIPLYFDFVQDESHRLGRRWGKDFSPVEGVYNFTRDTYLKGQKTGGEILGIQANLWTEKVASEKRLDFMIFPRLAALAEASWTQPENRNYNGFLKRLESLDKFYKKERIYYFNPAQPEKTPEVIDFTN